MQSNDQVFDQLRVEMMPFGILPAANIEMNGTSVDYVNGDVRISHRDGLQYELAAAWTRLAEKLGWTLLDASGDYTATARLRNAVGEVFYMTVMPTYPSSYEVTFRAESLANYPSQSSRKGYEVLAHTRWFELGEALLYWLHRKPVGKTQLQLDADYRKDLTKRNMRFLKQSTEQAKKTEEKLKQAVQK